MNQGRVSIRDVATLAGVSLGTVSNVLNSPGLVARATLVRVEQAIAELGWSRDESARQLAAGSSKTVGIILTDISNPLFTDLVAGVEDYAYKQGHFLQLGSSAQQVGREATMLEMFERQRVRGLLLAPIGVVEEQLARLQERNIPVVIIDPPVENPNCCSVAVDDKEGGRLAVEHLVRQGHKRIAFVAGSSPNQQIRDRRLGAEIGVGSRAPAQLVTMVTPCHDEGTCGVTAAEELAAMPDHIRPTGVFAANDLIALTLLQGLVLRGLRVPDDVAIIGCDDTDFAAASAIPLSSVRRPQRQLGQLATELLFDEMSVQYTDRPHVHSHPRLAPEVVVRRSTGGSA